MIDAEKLAKVKTMVAGGGEVDPLAAFDERELRKLRSEIDRLLPEDGLASVNLEQELVDQYRKTKQLMDDVLDDENTPANQKAQVANSVVGTLSQLSKLQEDLRKFETVKVMEAVLTESIKRLPEDVKAAFFEEYERMAKKAGLL